MTETTRDEKIDADEVLLRSCRKEIFQESGFKHTQNADLQEQIDASWIDNQMFEVNERVVINVLLFKAMFRKVQTGRENSEIQRPKGQINPQVNAAGKFAILSALFLEQPSVTNFLSILKLIIL